MYCDKCANKGRPYKYIMSECINCHKDKPMHEKEKICVECSERNFICQKCGINVLTGEKIGKERLADGKKEENWEMGKKGILRSFVEKNKDKRE